MWGGGEHRSPLQNEMVLPLSLLRTSQGHPMLVELKNGETYNGHLVSCDNWMNICLREVICTSRDGDRFWKLPELVVRGNNIKYLRIPEEVRCCPARPWNSAEFALPRGALPARIR